MIGLGVYFGLAAQQQRTVSQPAAQPPGLAQAPSDTAAASDPSAASTAHPSADLKADLGALRAPVPVDPDAARTAAQAALDALKPALIETCWAPALAAKPEPASARWAWDLTFDATGNEIARGISDVRGAERPDVAACLREQGIGLQIPAPGANTRVELELQLP